MSNENGSSNGMAEPAKVPVHGFKLDSADGFHLSIIVQFEKGMPYAMAEEIRRGADPLNCFLTALAQVRMMRVTTEFNPALVEQKKPMIQPASALPPVPRIIRP